MAEKKFCDYCGKDITGDETFSIAVFDDIKDREEFDTDACKKCAKRVTKVLSKMASK